MEESPMVWNKRSIGTLVAVIVLILLCAVKCSVSRPKPISSETYVDGNGDVHIYEQYDSRAGKALDPGSYALIMAAGVAILAAASNFRRRTVRLTALKNRCTASVPAVVTAVKSANGDGHIRYRSKVYNATYRYEYLGTTYESNNFCYGSRKRTFGDPIHVGDTEEICINPADPDELFDFLAEFSLKNSTVVSTLYSVMGLMFFVALLFH